MKKMNHLLGFMVLGLALSVTSCGKSFTVTFDTNDGSIVSAVTVDGKGTVGTVETPTKEGHNFAGWFLDEALTQEVDLATFVPTGDVTVYAKWTLESFDVKFEENGGTTVQDITVDWGSPVTLPASPTKEGYDFVKWYLDEEFEKPYANQPVKEDTTLYAKWQSGLMYFGSESGGAAYDAETGTYSFTINLPLWGRFSLMYYGNAISANDENLIITGLFNPEPGADWTRNLYCDVPEGGTEVDYTTFYCCKAGIYDITYNPTTNELAINDGTPPVVIPDTGFCYRYTEGVNAELVDFTTVELDPETNTYAFEVELAAWRYVEMYYNGVIVDSADENLECVFNTNGGHIYIGGSPDPTTSFYTSVANKYRFEYTPAVDGAKAKVVTSIVIDIPETGAYFTYTNSANAVVGPKESDITVEDGVYSITISLDQWKWVCVYKDGQPVAVADMTISGDGWVDGTYDNSTNGSLYVPEDAAHLMRSQAGAVEYKLSYNPTDNTLVIDNLSVGGEIDAEEDYVWTVASDPNAVMYTEAGAEIDTKALWRVYVIVDADGKIAYLCDMPKNGYGSPLDTNVTYARHSDYADPANNPAFVLGDGTYSVKVPEGGFIIEAHAGATSTAELVKTLTGKDYAEHSANSGDINVDNFRLSYDADAGTVTVNKVEVTTWTVASDPNAVMYTEAGAEIDTKALWRVYVIVDADGKIAYLCDMPKNGYGSPLDTNVTYARHSDYADPANNPAFVLGDGTYSVKVPEGGFIIEAHAGATSTAELVKTLTGKDYAEHSANSGDINVDNFRLSYDATTGVVTIVIL